MDPAPSTLPFTPQCFSLPAITDLHAPSKTVVDTYRTKLRNRGWSVRALLVWKHAMFRAAATCSDHDKAGSRADGGITRPL